MGGTFLVEDVFGKMRNRVAVKGRRGEKRQLHTNSSTAVNQCSLLLAPGVSWGKRRPSGE